IEALARTMSAALTRDDVRETVARFIDGMLASDRERRGIFQRFVGGLASVLGLIDRDRVVTALHTALHKIADDPDDPVRQRLAEVMAELPGRLRGDPALAARVEAIKTELLDGPPVVRLIEDTTRGLHLALIDDLDNRQSDVVRWITDQLESARATLATDTALRQQLERWLKTRAIGLVESYQGRIPAFI